MDDYQSWIGRSQTLTDVIAAAQANLMAKTMAVETGPVAEPFDDGDQLPPGWHWIYFLEADPTHSLGRDGHAKRGGFLPPIRLPRRMWAGSRMRFMAPLHIGDQVTKRSVIERVEEKTGRSGELCFVTVLHEYSRDETVLFVEEQDLVYREEPDPNAPVPEDIMPAASSQVTRTIHPHPVWLFRYSALTFNGHRIHYDVDYCRDVEGYPGLIFHGPLTATLLLDLAGELAAGRALSSFRFKGLSPIFDTGPFTLHGRAEDGHIELWATTQKGTLAVTAKAETAP